MWSFTILSAQQKWFELSYSGVVVGTFVATPTSLSLDVLHEYWKVHMKKTETSDLADKMDEASPSGTLSYFSALMW